MFKIDHVIIGVQDLPRAMGDYTALGFHVVYGGVHASGATHNALVVFKDGTYFELMGPTGDEATDAGPDYRPVLGNEEGIRGICMSTPYLTQTVETIRSRGGRIENVARGGRARPDGTQLEWLTAMQPDSGTFPFLMEDLTPREQRVPMTAETTTHPNGVTRMESITLPYTSDLQGQFEAILSSDPAYNAPQCDSFGCRFEVAGITLDLSHRKSDPALTLRVPGLVKSLVDEQINAHGVYFWLSIGDE